MTSQHQPATPDTPPTPATAPLPDWPTPDTPGTPVATINPTPVTTAAAVTPTQVGWPVDPATVPWMEANPIPTVMPTPTLTPPVEVIAPDTPISVHIHGNPIRTANTRQAVSDWSDPPANCDIWYIVDWVEHLADRVIAGHVTDVDDDASPTSLAIDLPIRTVTITLSTVTAITAWCALLGQPRAYANDDLGTAITANITIGAWTIHLAHHIDRTQR